MDKTLKTKKRRGFFRLIQRIIEFYMSDANLRRDKYLLSQFNEQMEVHPSVFLQFNRIRELKATINDVVVALKPSRILEATLTAVKRKFPVTEKSKEDVDKCSIYVEPLPPDMNPEFLAKIFSAFGKVILVTIPRYPSNKKVKGYGFIEFEDESSCRAALETFSGFGGVLAEDCASCSKLHDIENDSNEADGEESAPKRQKLDDESEKPAAKEPETMTKNEKRKRRRKRKKWPKMANFAYMGLQIMSKESWNQLRHRYLCIQAANRRHLKAQLAKIRKPVNRHEKFKAIIPRTIISITREVPFTEMEIASLKFPDFVEYVDVKVGSTSGYVRISQPPYADSFIRHGTNMFSLSSAQVLTPEAETAYLEKIEKDRVEMKTRQRLSNVSGVQKILKKAEKYFIHG